MKKKAAYFIAVLASSVLAFSAQGQSRNRMINHAYVAFDLPESIGLDEGVRFYKKCPDPDVKLDLYYPKPEKMGERKGLLPCIMIIHGGGWRMGNEKKHAMMSVYLASHGYVVACITYRLMPEYGIDDSVEDCMRALYWLKKNAKKYGGNPDKIGVAGGSAGGQLAALMAVIGGKGMYKKIFSDGTSDKIQAAIPMAPVVDLTKWANQLRGRGDAAERAKRLSPIFHVDKDSAPMLLLHCKNDPTVNVSESERMKAEYDKNGVPCETIFYDSAEHAFWNAAPVDPTRLRSWNDILNFFNKTLK